MNAPPPQCRPGGAFSFLEVAMSPIFTKTGSLFARVVSSQTFKRGIAGAAGAILTATIAEIFFPSEA
jgi:hypothetical protein